MKKTLLILGLILSFAFLYAQNAPQGNLKNVAGERVATQIAATENPTRINGRDVIFSENFNTTPSQGIPAGWVQEHVGSGAEWIAVDALYSGGIPTVVSPDGTMFMTNLWNGAGPRNAWLISSGFTLAAGESYEISFYLKLAMFTGEVDHFRVNIGQTQTAAGMLSGDNIYENTTTPIANWTVMTFTYTPTASGTFYIGFHAFSPADQGNDIDIEDVLITGAGVTPDPCDPATNLDVVYTPDCKAQLTWTAPAKSSMVNEPTTIVHRDKNNIKPVPSRLELLQQKRNKYQRKGTSMFTPSFAKGNTAYGVFDFEEYWKFDVDNILEATYLNDMPEVCGGTYYDGKFYAYDYDGMFSIYDHATGNYITDMSYPQPYWVTALAYDYTTNTMYGMGWHMDTEVDVFFTVDITTGELSNIKNITGFTGEWPIAFAIDLEGTIFVLDFYDEDADYYGNLYTMNKTTGACSLRGCTNRYIFYYDQSMAFDLTDGTLYLCEINDGDEPEGECNFVKINPANGAVTIITPDIDLQITALNFVYNNPNARTYNVYRDNQKIASVSQTSYTDSGFDITEGHTWKVTVACPSEESDPVEKTMEACPVACDKITNGTVTITATAAILTWTAVEGATGYKVTRGEFTKTVETPTCTEEGEFEIGVEYKWTVVTICGSDESDPVEIKDTYVGIDDIKFASFSIVPNPAQNDITISAGVNFNKVEIINFLGQTVISQTNDDQTVKIDVSNLTNGVYFVRIASENGMSVKKFVKQ